jgi:hypothetical protein
LVGRRSEVTRGRHGGWLKRRLGKMHLFITIRGITAALSTRPRNNDQNASIQPCQNFMPMHGVGSGACSSIRVAPRAHATRLTPDIRTSPYPETMLSRQRTGLLGLGLVGSAQRSLDAPRPAQRDKGVAASVVAEGFLPSWVWVRHEPGAEQCLALYRQLARSLHTL